MKPFLNRHESYACVFYSRVTLRIHKVHVGIQGKYRYPPKCNRIVGLANVTTRANKEMKYTGIFFVSRLGR